MTDAELEQCIQIYKDGGKSEESRTSNNIPPISIELEGNPEYLNEKDLEAWYEQQAWEIADNARKKFSSQMYPLSLGYRDISDEEAQKMLEEHDKGYNSEIVNWNKDLERFKSEGQEPSERWKAAYQEFLDHDKQIREDIKNKRVGFPGCIYNVMSAYGKPHVTYNPWFAQNHEKEGFIKIDPQDAQEGDVVQVFKDSNPYHMLMFTGFNENGERTFDWARGAEHDGMQHNGEFPDSEGQKVYYRYIGSDKDKESWKNNYYSKKKAQKKEEGGTLENVNLDQLAQELNKEEEEEPQYKQIKLCREGSILDQLKEQLPDNEIFDLISKFGIDDLLTGGIKKGTSVSIQIIMSDGDKEETDKTPKLQEIEIGDKTYKVEIVSTEEDMEKGLGERKSLDKDKGMLFDFKGVQEEVTFNCEEMLFPIDIIFINNDDEVIRVAENCQPGKDLFTENNVRYVLEVNAKSGIKQGDDLDISPSNSPTMKVLAPDGSTQMELQGGERIFSRQKTKQLIKWAKKADKSKSDSDYKRLGNIMFKELYAQDHRDPEYVEVPEN